MHREQTYRKHPALVNLVHQIPKPAGFARIYGLPKYVLSDDGS
jgi:hypothetical protein